MARQSARVGGSGCFTFLARHRALCPRPPRATPAQHMHPALPSHRLRAVGGRSWPSAAARCAARGPSCSAAARGADGVDDQRRIPGLLRIELQLPFQERSSTGVRPGVFTAGKGKVHVEVARGRQKTFDWRTAKVLHQFRPQDVSHCESDPAYCTADLVVSAVGDELLDTDLVAGTHVRKTRGQLQDPRDARGGDSGRARSGRV